MEFFAGYQWSHPKRIRPYVSGVIACPRAIEWKTIRRRLILDNGAFPAWRDSIELDEAEQLDSLIKSARRHKPEMIVVPDIVSQGAESFERTRRTIPELYAQTRKFRPRLLIAVQEGMKIWDAVELAEQFGGGLFIGGSSYMWKRHAVTTARAMSEGVYIHSARIWREGDCHWHSSRVQSFDNTTFGRGQHFNTSRPFDVYLDRYAKT